MRYSFLLVLAFAMATSGCSDTILTDGNCNQCGNPGTPPPQGPVPTNPEGPSGTNLGWPAPRVDHSFLGAYPLVDASGSTFTWWSLSGFAAAFGTTQDDIRAAFSQRAHYLKPGYELGLFRSPNGALEAGYLEYMGEGPATAGTHAVIRLQDGRWIGIGYMSAP